MIQITSQTCSEVYDIINHMDKELIQKIPMQFVNLLEQARDKNINIKIDYSKSINDQKVEIGTRALLSLIYRDYLCSENERNQIIQQDMLTLRQDEITIEQEKREKYNPNDLFKRSNKNNSIENIEQTNIQETELVEYKDNFFAKFKKFILKLLHIKS